MEHGGNGNITRSERRERGSVLAVLAALIRQNKVYATLEGRFDSVFWPWQGYGHLNQFKARLVLRRVLKVETTQ